MKIAVVSDTHDNISAIDKFLEIAEEEKLRYVFHLGDIISPFTLKKFLGFKYYGVYGNNDGEKLLLKKISDELGFLLEESPLSLELFGKNFLLLHGFGSIEKTGNIVNSFAKSGDFDYVLYGHTHRVDNRRFGKTIVLNPGELCGYLTGRKTFAVIDLDNNSVEIREI